MKRFAKRVDGKRFQRKKKVAQTVKVSTFHDVTKIEPFTHEWGLQCVPGMFPDEIRIPYLRKKGLIK